MFNVLISWQRWCSADTLYNLPAQVPEFITLLTKDDQQMFIITIYSSRKLFFTIKLNASYQGKSSPNDVILAKHGPLYTIQM